METNRCGQFSLEIEELYVTGAPVLLRVPIRRCALAERMIALIARTENGREVARRLTLDSSSFSEEAAKPDEGSPAADSGIRAAFGPDLDAIHPKECTTQRCLESCTPNYKLILQQFGYEEDAERETGTGCLEEFSAERDAVSINGSSQ